VEIVPEIDKSKVTPIRKKHKSLKSKEKLAFVNRADLAAILGNPELDTVAKLACWVAVPPDERQPKHQKDLAKLLDVHESILSRIKNTPEFTSMMTECSRQIAAEHNGAILRALVARCLGGNVPAIELYLNKINKWEKEGISQPAPSPNTTNIEVMIGDKVVNALPIQGARNAARARVAEGNPLELGS
jgi:Helix-turn-helix of insertion element transposase